MKTIILSILATACFSFTVHAADCAKRGGGTVHSKAQDNHKSSFDQFLPGGQANAAAQIKQGKNPKGSN